MKKLLMKWMEKRHEMMKYLSDIMIETRVWDM